MDVWMVEAGVIVARVKGLVSLDRVPAGQTTLPAADYAESAIGDAPVWPRAKRDALLAAADWTQTADAPLTSDQIAAAKAYRTALRNLPATSADAASIAWPAPPSFIQPL
jgi:hypothetical protein